MAESLREIPSAFDSFQRHSATPTAREWRLHGTLFLLTVVSTIIAGTFLAAPAPPIAEPPLRTISDYVLYIPLSYIYSIVAYFKLALLHPQLIANGATFSASLLA